MESDVGRDTNKLFIVPDITSLGDIVIQIIRYRVLAYLTKVCEHFKRNNKAVNPRLYAAT